MNILNIFLYDLFIVFVIFVKYIQQHLTCIQKKMHIFYFFFSPTFVLLFWGQIHSPNSNLLQYSIFILSTVLYVFVFSSQMHSYSKFFRILNIFLYHLLIVFVILAKYILYPPSTQKVYPFQFGKLANQRH